MVELLLVATLIHQVHTNQIFGEVNWEVPAGTINGANLDFTVDSAALTIRYVSGRQPLTGDHHEVFYWRDGANAVDQATLMLYRNGVLQKETEDYTFVVSQGGFISILFPVGL